jgi:hypothetical protein
MATVEGKVAEGESLDPPEYVKVVIDTIQQDIGRLHVRVVAALGIVAVVVSKVKDVQKLDGGWQWPKFIGLGLLVAAALLYFQYTQELNKARIQIVKRLPNSYVEKDALLAARAAWEPFIGDPRWFRFDRGKIRWYTLAQACFLAGSALVAVVLARLIA